MIIVTASERNQLVKTIDGTRNVDWVFASERQIEEVLDPLFIRQLFVHRTASAGDKLRIVARDGELNCFVDMIILAFDPKTDRFDLADMSAPGRPCNGLTIRYREQDLKAAEPEVETVIAGERYLSANGRTEWKGPTKRWCIYVEETEIVAGIDDKDTALAIACGKLPLPAVEKAA